MSLVNEQLYLAFFSMGKDRSIPKLSLLTGRSEDSLRKMSQRHGWKTRLAQDEKELAEKNYREPSKNELLQSISRDSLDKLALAVKTIYPKTPQEAKIMLDIHNTVTAGTTQEDSSDTGESFVDVLRHILQGIPDEYAKHVMDRFDNYVAAQLFGD